MKPVERIDVDFLFARRETRTTDGGGSISYKSRIYTPSGPESSALAHVSVEIRDTLSGKIWAVYNGRRIEMKEVGKPERATPSKVLADKKDRPVKSHKTAPDHPWRSGFKKHPNAANRYQDQGVTLSLNT